MHAQSAFLQFWWTDKTRDTFLSCLPKDDLASLRLACHDFGARAAPILFEEISVTFRTSVFTKPTRMAALGRMGHHVKTLHFTIPHGPETFLPPLLDPITGEETTFIYEPYILSSRDPTSRLSIPTYGSWEITDMLVKQYQPLFHAAANVPSFIRAFSAIPNLKHLKVSCPGQEPNQRYRRSIVDYALISLRIAVERSQLSALKALSLLSVHPSAVFYLNPLMGFGASPSSARRWRQIRELRIEMDTITLGYPSDHLKLLHSYLQLFSSTIKEFRFRWLGDKAPCPLSLGTEKCLEASSPNQACPRTCHLALRPLQFRRLKVMEVENTMIDASQISSFITSHRHTLRDFNFEDTHLRKGTWDEALAPLTRISGSDKWKQNSEEVMDVPIMLSPVDLEQDQLNKVWDDHIRCRSSKPLHGALHRAGAKGRELLFGTEEHMRKFLSGFSWR
ncbi:hypothetical protein P7C71_g552, partial [Lecanoromycetidae sp. Uapishka_2]